MAVLQDSSGYVSASLRASFGGRAGRNVDIRKGAAVKCAWSMWPPPDDGSSWPSARVPLTLPCDEIHVWRVPGPPLPRILTRLTHVLAPDERHRAARYRFAADRDQFVLARAMLRVVLGGYLDVPPERLELQTGPTGKPALRCSEVVAPLGFSVSRSSGPILFAIARTPFIGIDAEEVAPDLPLRSLAADFFTVSERRLLEGVAPQAFARTFFVLWTAKEAYAKASGIGLAAALETVEIDIAEQTGAVRISSTDPPPGIPAACTPWLFSPSTGSIATLVCDGESRQPHCFDCSLPETLPLPERRAFGPSAAFSFVRS